MLLFSFIPFSILSRLYSFKIENLIFRIFDLRSKIITFHRFSFLIILRIKKKFNKFLFLQFFNFINFHSIKCLNVHPYPKFFNNRSKNPKSRVFFSVESHNCFLCPHLIKARITTILFFFKTSHSQA